MTLPGRPPKPTHLKVLAGNPGKRPLNMNEPKPKPLAPKCPSWLDPEAKREWKRVAPELERLGLLTVVDGAALAAYCQAYARWVKAERVLKEKGMTMITPNGYEQQRPEVGIANKAMQQIRAFCHEFGLSPSARARMTLPEEPDGDDFFD